MNGFTPDESKFCYGLPGKSAPFGGGFDPFGISTREDYETVKTFRESEVTHGRVAMLAGKESRDLSDLMIDSFSFSHAYRLFLYDSVGFPRDRTAPQVPSSL